MKNDTSIHPCDINDYLKSCHKHYKCALRSVFFNLILYRKAARKTGYMDKIFSGIAKRFPSRSIIINENNSSEKDLIQADVKVNYSEEFMYHDCITLDVSQESREKISSAIIPQIIPDRPVYLFVDTEADFNKNLYTELEKYATRIIFESYMPTKLAKFASTILDFHEKHKCAITDLNYSKMYIWMSLLSTTFNTKEKLDSLRQSESITIYYNASDKDRHDTGLVGPLYLQAWLASKLSWERQNIYFDGSCAKLEYVGTDGTIYMNIVGETHSGVEAGSVVKMDLRSRSGDNFVLNTNTQHKNEINIQRSTGLLSKIPVTYMFTKTAVEDLIMQEIHSVQTAEIFITILESMKNY